jgi:hypothetical protein
MYSDSPPTYPVQFGQPDSIIRPLNEIRVKDVRTLYGTFEHYTRTEISRLNQSDL